MRCFGLKQAEGVMDHNLKFSWKIKKNKDQGSIQSAYEIQILKESKPIYDTGKIKGRSSCNVQIEVPILLSSEKYGFRIKVWDQNGNESGWSAISFFITGILEQKDWNRAQFIIVDEKSIDFMTDSVWYRKQIYVEEPIRQAVIHVAGIGIHELYINGEKVSMRILAPAKSKINDLTRVMYVTYDVTEYLKEGDNVIGIWNDAYWARQSELPADPAVKCILKVKGQNKIQLFISDRNWECKASNISHRGGWEWSDFGGEIITGTPDGSWCMLQSPYSDWDPVKEVEINPVLTPDLTGGSIIYETFFPTKIKSCENKTIVDFGKKFYWLGKDKII